VARIFLNIPDESWEPLYGVFPDSYLDTHPSGRYIAFQIVQREEDFTEKAGIWDTQTKKLIWNPKNVNALCWIGNGNELLVVERIYQPEHERPSIFVTPTQSEYKHFMRILSWPGLETISCLELHFPHGWLIDVVTSPVNNIASYVWQDQCESGIEFVSWEDGNLHQLPKKGFYCNSNLIRGPVFNSDGTLIAMTFGVGIWWADTPEMASEGGIKNVGFLIWGEVGSGLFRRIDIEVNISKGWKPNDPEDILHNEFLSLPEFVCPNEVKIILPTSEECVLYLQG